MFKITIYTKQNQYITLQTEDLDNLFKRLNANEIIWHTHSQAFWIHTNEIQLILVDKIPSEETPKEEPSMSPACTNC